MNGLLLVVPAFNEEQSIAATIDTLRSQPHDFIVVNDGSTDRTAQIARQKGARVISLPFNQGLAGAFLAGMEYADAMGYDYVMQFDADGQHLPEYIQPMLDRAKCSGADILIGSRFLEHKMPISARTFGSLIIRGMVRLTTGNSLTDPTSGMRLYNAHMIRLFAHRVDLTPEPDTIAYLMRSGIRVEEFPITMRQRMAGTSYLSSWSAVRYMSRMAFSILMIQFARSRVEKKEVEV